MNAEEFSKLKRGDIVQNTGSGNSYVIAEQHGDWFIGVRTIAITHPSEWEKFIPAENQSNSTK